MPKQPIFSEKEIYKIWSLGKPISYKNKKYVVNKMSYGDYFLEPIMSKEDKKKYYGETKPFHPKTIWLERKIKTNQYGFPQVYYEEEK